MVQLREMPPLIIVTGPAPVKVADDGAKVAAEAAVARPSEAARARHRTGIRFMSFPPAVGEVSTPPSQVDAVVRVVGGIEASEAAALLLIVNISVD